jgi:hypothetical protein
MDDTMYKKQSYLPIASLICTILLLVACAGEENIRMNQDPILGEWTNDKNMTILVHRTPGNELVAEIISAPGFFDANVGAGKMIIRNIQPFQTRYSGIFVMPGDEKSVKVQIRFSNRNTLVFSTEDKRAQGNLMIWYRIIKSNKLLKSDKAAK